VKSPLIPPKAFERNKFMYYIFSILTIAIAAFFIISLASADKKESTKFTKALKISSFVYSLAGIIFSASVAVILNGKLKDTGLTEEYVSWAKDMFHGFCRFCILFFLIITLLSLISFFVSKKLRIIRTLLILSASIIILIMGVMYSYIASNDTVSLSAYVQLFALGMSAAAVYPVFFEFIRLENSLLKKDKQ